MNRTLMLLGAIFAFSFANAQNPDYDDTNIASHDIEVTVEEIALLDVYDANTGINTEAGTVTLSIDHTGIEKQEAGLYDFTDFEETNFYLNYTSIVSSTVAANLNTLRNISVKLLATSELPGSTKLVISAEAPVLENTNGGDPGSLASSSLTFLASDITAGTSQTLVNNIGSVYTGDGAYGVKLTYNLEQDGDFASYKAGTFTSTIQYTLSDL